MSELAGQRDVEIRPPAAQVRRTELANGVRVLTDLVNDATSATFAVWVGVGGRDEPVESAGSSHFLEHLLFKGTPTRDALQLALEVDGVGGDMNAYTSSEHTAYFVRVPATEADVAIDILLDVVTDPVLTEDDFDGEREVILAELAAAEDDPEDLAGVQLFESLFPDDPLGRDVLGTADSIDGLTRDGVADFFSSWYGSPNLVVTGAGSIDHESLVAAVESRLGSSDQMSKPTRVAPEATVVPQVVLERPFELVQLAFGWRALGACDPDRHALGILNHVLGSGPSSRLFQRVREDRGLTYSITSGLAVFTDVGALSIQCGTSPEKVAEVSSLVAAEVRGLVESGITADELARAKRAIRGGLLLGLEDSGSRSARLGISETIRGSVTPLDDYLAMVQTVSTEDVLRVARRVFTTQMAFTAVGPVGTGDVVKAPTVIG